MNKKLIYRKLKNRNNWLVVCLLLLSHVIFSQSIENLYVKMPDILNPTLSAQNRFELVEYVKAHKGDSIENRFGKQAHLLVLDTLNKRIVVQNTPTSVFEMKVNNLKNGKPYIGIIRTICAPICNSVVEFYDTAWNAIPIQFTMPKAVEWVDLRKIKKDIVDINWVKKTSEISFVTLSFSDKNNEIVAKNNSFEFLSEVDRKTILPFVFNQQFKYRLVDKTWIRTK